jgi:hypothetical protein
MLAAQAPQRLPTMNLAFLGVSLLSQNAGQLHLHFCIGWFVRVSLLCGFVFGKAIRRTTTTKQRNNAAVGCIFPGVAEHRGFYETGSRGKSLFQNYERSLFFL